MDPATVFHQSLGSVLPPQHFFPGRAPVPGPYPWDNPEQGSHDAPHRVAHTLTACHRCRKRKTRCDPALPRCLPCERAGSTCEYYDSAKGRNVNRSHVVILQKRVRELEAELAQYTDQDNDDPYNYDDMVFPGGIVRLNETDETPRYLGPSSGTAMTRLLMEEAKRYAESRRIASLIPAVLARRAEQRDRMQSVVMGTSISGPSDRTKSYPPHSIIPASGLPSREIVDGLVRAFNDRIQVFTPILHEKMFEEDVNSVFAGDTDPYKHFVVNMVVAISLQKMGKYAGLPDSYYLNAMRRFEDVVCPQDLKTLQCLVLIGQYSFMTPTRTATYYVTGLATRICQQMRLGDEGTIGMGVTDPLDLDMRRRVSWIVTAQELGLANIMGRPNGLAKADDFIDVKFFEPVLDEDITPEGIRSGNPCEKKIAAIHFCKMRLLQAEIRRVLYEKKRPQPSQDLQPWFVQMEQRLTEWVDACPTKPAWFKPCMIISLYRPSPQVPKPAANAAMRCFEGSRSIIDLTNRQIEEGTVDISWESLLTVYASLNALLWSISYAEVRDTHNREDVQDLAATALEAIKIFSDRWPGSSSAVQLYTVIADACLQSYDAGEETPSPPPGSQLGTPVTLAGPKSPESDTSRDTPTRQTQPQSATSLFNTSSPFGYVFDAANNPLGAQYGFESEASPFPHQPSFRSNSIFMSPSTDANGRRLSNLAPDSNEASAPSRMGTTPPPLLAIPKPEPAPPVTTPLITSLPSPPESLAPTSAQPGIHLSPRLTRETTPMQTPTLHNTTPVPIPHHTPAPIIHVKQEPLELFHSSHFQQHRPQGQHHHQQQQQSPHPELSAQAGPRRPPPPFVTPPPQPQHIPQQHQHQQQPQQPQQRPPPSHGPVDWYNPLPQFIPPHVFTSGMGGGPSFWNGTPNPFTGNHLNPNVMQVPYGAARNGVPSGGGLQHTASWNLDGFGAGGPQDGGVGGGGGSGGGGGGGGGGGMFAPAGPGLAPGPGPGPGFGYSPGMAGDYYDSFMNGRHGSLSHEQQLELMDVLETEGMSDIDSFLNLGMGGAGGAGGGMGGPGGVQWG
ncbi:fungal-specific transcription factor domain-containing protein [Chaetomium fimeti]|uniref:Fungal-specific transcription factor domain-containing protein n=1 Tax=Chaetomium fimeti TaxID=1854472 RepID=A0AAE0LNY2_9PEZI|nr:fungal-specific transcription factor domain-containing protein [Chaetomium fimeti]